MFVLNCFCHFVPLTFRKAARTICTCPWPWRSKQGATKCADSRLIIFISVCRRLSATVVWSLLCIAARNVISERVKVYGMFGILPLCLKVLCCRTWAALSRKKAFSAENCCAVVRLASPVVAQHQFGLGQNKRIVQKKSNQTYIFLYAVEQNVPFLSFPSVGLW